MTVNFPAAQNEDVSYVRTKGNFGRRFAALVVSAIMMLLLIFGSLFHVAGNVLSSSTTVSNFVIGVATDKNVSAQIADTALTTICKNETQQVCNSIQQNHAALVAAFQRAVNDPATQSAFRQAVAQVYAASKSGTAEQVSFEPVVQDIMTALHNADPAVPAQVTLIGQDFSVNVTGHSGTNFSGGGAVIGLALIIVAIAGAVLVGRFIVRHPIRQLVAVGLIIGIPALIDMGISRAFSGFGTHLKSGTATSRALLTQVFDKLGSQFTSLGVTLLIVDLAVVLGWLVIRVIVDRRGYTPTPAATN